MYEIYSKINCSYCEKAKQLLVQEGYEHKVKILGVHFEVADLYKVAPNSHRTFPMITKHGEYLGGYSELVVDVEKGVTEL